MKSFCVFLVLLATCCAQTAGGPQTAPTAPGQQVTMVVSATELGGTAVSDLATEQVSVLDNHLPAKVLAVRPASAFPLHIAIVLLASKSTFGQQQSAAADLVRKVMRPNIDRAFVISAGGDKGWSNARIDWKNDAEQTEKAIRALNKNEGLPDRFGYTLETSSVASTRMALQKYSDSSALNIFNVIWSMWASDPRPARRVVVLFRDPMTHSPGRNGVYSKRVEAELARTIAEAQQRKTALYAIGLDEQEALPTSLTEIYGPTQTGAGGWSRVFDQEMSKQRDLLVSAGRANVERLAIETGGRLWISKGSKFCEAINGILSDMNSMYLVTFAPSSELHPGDSHVVRIESNRKDVRVDAASAYYYGPPVRTEHTEQATQR